MLLISIAKKNVRNVTVAAMASMVAILPQN